MKQTAYARSLRMALAGNAVFSSICGTLMILFPTATGELLGLPVAWLWIVAGFGLLLFAGDLLHQATRPRMATWRALYASAADFLWVISTFALLLFFPGLLTSTGTVLAVAVAGLVCFFGIWQLRGIGQYHRLMASVQGVGLYRHCVMVTVDVSPQAMWDVISDMGNIQQFMPELRYSALREHARPGEGAVRECEDRSGKRWAEECTDFVPGRSLTLRFLCEEPDFPFPASVMRGGWEVVPQSEGCLVKVWWELVPRPRLLGPVLLPVLAFRVDRDFPGVIARMAERAAGQNVDAGAGKKDGVVTRLLPAVC